MTNTVFSRNLVRDDFSSITDSTEGSNTDENSGVLERGIRNRSKRKRVFSSTIRKLYTGISKSVSGSRHGKLLIDKLSVKCFTEAQIAKATNNFDHNNLVGVGGSSRVYKGSLLGMAAIAVKKPKFIDAYQIDSFLNEVEILNGINHKNVVKLLGVCPASKVPMLVFEFAQNGNLYRHLHGSISRLFDSWRMCLRVALESARALDYMHSLAQPPMIHGDFKSTHILLDGTYTAKVADFGYSRLMRVDSTEAIETLVQGTMGYLDPEYFHTGELTTMSDVYGFGVVLMELLSKQKPTSQGIYGEINTLVDVFRSAIEKNNFAQVLKVAEISEYETQQAGIVAKLAMRCVAMPSTERPTMTEVADVLNGLSKEYTSFPVEDNDDEIVSLLDDPKDISAL